VASCSLLNPSTFGDCISGVVKGAAGDAFDSIATSFGQAAHNATNWLWNQLGAATAVHLGGSGFSKVTGIVATIAAVVGLALFMVQVIQSVLRREPGGLARAVKGLLVAFVAGAAAAGVVDLLLGAVDALCNGVVQMVVGTDTAGLGRLVLGSAATATLAGLVTGAGGAAGVLLLSLAILAAVVIVYLALVVRKVLIVVTAVFAPLAFAGSLADITVSWTRRWIEVTVALIASKLILVLIFVVGYFMLVKGLGQSGAGVTQQVTQVVSGVVVLSLAGFAPWLALKVVHFTGDHAHQLHAMAATSTSGAMMAGRMGQKAMPLAGKAVSSLLPGKSEASLDSSSTSPGPTKGANNNSEGPLSPPGDAGPGKGPRQPSNRPSSPHGPTTPPVGAEPAGVVSPSAAPTPPPVG